MSHDVHAHRDVLESAGPAFIKWGQWAATRHDLFPPDFCAILEHLHTQVGACNLRPGALSSRSSLRSCVKCVLPAPQ